jgi:protein-S-isoprenylcysteine O-methyltransferase Ste14
MREQSAGRRGKDPDTAGVIARPPVLFLIALLLGHTSDRVLPIPFAVSENPACAIVAAVLILCGLMLAGGGIRDFARAATPVPTNQPVRALVATGVHGWSRNPIYVGMFLVYAGIGVGARSAWTVILALPLAVVIRYGVVAREEAYLERRFGDAYRVYKVQVRRWL